MATFGAFVFMQHTMLKFKPNLKNKTDNNKIIQNSILTLLARYNNFSMS